MKTKKASTYLILLISLILPSWSTQDPTAQITPTPESIPTQESMPETQHPGPTPPSEPQPPHSTPTTPPTEVSTPPPGAMPSQTSPTPSPPLPSPIPAPGTPTKETPAPIQVQSQATGEHQAEALVLSCADFRLNDDASRILEKEGLKEKYDLIVIPGGTLSATNDFFPSWRETFWSSTAILKNLHHFKKVILIDHRDCGAYKMVYGRDLSKNPEEEKKIHMSHSQKLKRQIKKKYPDLKVDIWLLALDGSYEKTDVDK